MQNLISANDSFMAALEISKPTEALLGSALTWLKTHTHLNNSVISPVTVTHDHGGYFTPVEHERSLVGTYILLPLLLLCCHLLSFFYFFYYFILISSVLIC